MNQLLNPIYCPIKKQGFFFITTLIKRVILLLSAFLFLLGIYLLIDREQDMNILREIIYKEIGKVEHNGSFVEKLNQIVYNKGGFKKNSNFFFIKKLGPTPIQILTHGGDCSDKSRLLSAMLLSVGIPSTLVMLHSCAGCPPNHTVVEVRDKNNYMVADPVYNLVFPKTKYKYFSLEELMNNPEILNQRLDELIKIRGINDKIYLYKRHTEIYSFPKTINWDKNKLTYLIKDILYNIDKNPNLISRPHFLEDPKLFLSITSLFACSILLFIYFVMCFLTRKSHKL